MYGGTIEQNSSAMYGGGVYVGTAHFEFHGGTVQNNTAGTNGGGLYLSGKTLGLTGIGFDGTVDDWSAGGEIEIPMGVSAFRSNDNGAAAGSGKFFVTGNQVNGTASASGGGIYVGNCTDLKLSNVKINSNGFGGSNGQGAGVYITGCSGAEFLNCAITENKNAAWGCGLSVSSSASAQIKDCVISKNTGSSTCQGGGVYTQGTVSFTGSSITGNSAGTGGGVYVRKGTATFDSTAPDGNILCNNTANTEAADVYAAKDNTTSVPLPDAAGMKQVYAADGKEKTIDGWYWDASDSRYQPSTDGIPYNNDPAFGTANVSLIASYKDAAEYTITFQPGDHGTLENAGTDGNVTHTLAEGNAFPTPPETTPEKHYAFDGWYNADGKKVENFPKTVTANATYTAHWKKASVTVTYQFVGEAPTGAVVPASETVNIGTLFTPTAPAEVEGWKFDGWYKENDCTEKFTDGTTLTSDTTLYGKWMEKAEIFNTPPVITAEDKTLTVGDAFDPMADVTASDAEDGDITKDIKVISNTVDTSKAGVYEVTYQVRDSQGASCTKTIKVTVKDKDTQKPTPDDNDKPGNNTGNPTKPDGTSPQTGDTSHIGLWISLLAVSLLGIGAALLTWKKKTCRGRWEK